MKTFKDFLLEETSKPLTSLKGFESKKVTGQSTYIDNGKVVHDGSTYEHEKVVSPGRKITISNPTEKIWSEKHANGEHNTISVGVHDTKHHEYATYGTVHVHPNGKITSYNVKTKEKLTHDNLHDAINHHVKKIPTELKY
jgi:hypothetical protein